MVLWWFYNHFKYYDYFYSVGILKFLSEIEGPVLLTSPEHFLAQFSTIQGQPCSILFRNDILITFCTGCFKVVKFLFWGVTTILGFVNSPIRCNNAVIIDNMHK